MDIYVEVEFLVCKTISKGLMTTAFPCKGEVP